MHTRERERETCICVYVCTSARETADCVGCVRAAGRREWRGERGRAHARGTQARVACGYLRDVCATASRRVASRRVASRLELTVARYRSFEAALRCRWPHDNIDKLAAANSRQSQRLVTDVVVGASLMTLQPPKTIISKFLKARRSRHCRGRGRHRVTVLAKPFFVEKP